MAETAYNVQYRQEWIRGFERRQALLRTMVETNQMSESTGAKQAVLLVATTNREAVTRGNNGLIPAAADDLSQVTVDLVEEHDLPQKTRFNIFVGQANQRAIMQEGSRGVINRAIDRAIITALMTGTIVANPSAPRPMDKALVTQATTKLWNANVNNDGQVFGLLTPAAWAALTDEDTFTSIDYNDFKPLVNGAPTTIEGVEMKRWMGVIWVMHNGLPGLGTLNAKCVIWHKSAVGHAYSDIDARSGYNEEQDYSWTRTSIFHGAKKIQNAGIVIIEHDDTIYS